MNKNTKKTLGFTLIEAIIIIAILGLLASIAIPRIIISGTDANDAVIRKILQDTRRSIQQAQFLNLLQLGTTANTMVNAIYPGGYMGRNPLNGLNSVCFIDPGGVAPPSACYFGNTGNCPVSSCSSGNFTGHPDTGSSDFGWIYEPLSPPYIWAYQDGYRHL